MKNRTVALLQTAEKQPLGAGLSVMVPFPTRKLTSIDPFVLFHHMLPAYQHPGEAIRFSPHPHKGFETVTLVLEGEMEHCDSYGGHGIIKEGGVQWMTAGSGVLHSEGPSPNMQQQGGSLQLIQLWINLPAACKATPPKYQNIQPAAIPLVEQEGVRIQVIAGTFGKVQGPAQTFTPMQVLQLTALEKTCILLPVDPAFNALAYGINGRMYSNGQSFVKCQVVQFANNGDFIELTMEKGAQLLLLAGAPLNEPMVADGPFVMNSTTEIEQAYNEYKAGKFGSLAY